MDRKLWQVILIQDRQTGLAISLKINLPNANPLKTKLVTLILIK